MWLVLAVLVLCGCGGATSSVAVENRGGTASTSCVLPARFDFEARRYANVDADSPDSQTWSAWRVGIQLSSTEPPRGTITGTGTMVGDELVWTFDLTGKLDRERCTLDLWTDEHEGKRVLIDVRARTGSIHSIDDRWQLASP